MRAPSPGLTVGVVFDSRGPRGHHRDLNTAESFGDVSCVVTTTDLGVSGQPVSPTSLSYDKCQRTGPHLSVFLPGSSFEGNGGRATVLALTDAAYNAAAGN